MTGEQRRALARSFGVPPTRRRQTPRVLVLALLAGLIAMHGLTGTAFAAARATHRPVMAGHTTHGPPPVAPVDAPHHGPSAGPQAPCLAALPGSAGAGSVRTVLSPLAAVAVRVDPAPPHAALARPANARVERPPLDLTELCVSRT